MRVSITRIDRSLPLPSYQTEGAAGFDFLCRLDVTVEPRTLGFLPSNVIVAVPEGHVLMVTLRSSTPRRKGLLCPHGVGIIDSDYRGLEDEIQIQVYNYTDEPVTAQRGERIAQGILLPIGRCQWEERDGADAPTRGGFGSTG